MTHFKIVHRNQLVKEEIHQVIKLAETCEKHDEIHLKPSLNFSMIKDRTLLKNHYWLCYDRDQLIGFLGAYFIIDNGEVEITGMVNPLNRRKNVFTSLLEKALLENDVARCNKLLIAEQKSESATYFCEKIGASYSFSEYGLGVTLAHIDTCMQNKITLSTVTEQDYKVVSLILQRGFGDCEDDVDNLMQRNTTDRHHTMLVVKTVEALIGTMTVYSDDDKVAYISAFVIDPEYQGKGYGRIVLQNILHHLKEKDFLEVLLDVETDNMHALKLYESVGFNRISGYDYYKINN